MKLAESIKTWLNQENASPGRKFLQISVLILGGIFAMALGCGLVGVILLTTPVVTVVVIAFLIIYGIVALVRH